VSASIVRPRPTNAAAARAARRTRRELTLGLCLLALVGLAAWVSTVAIDGAPWSSPYEVRIAIPAGAPVLTAGDEVRLGGVRVGQVQSVSLAGRAGATAEATLAVAQTLGAGARARIRPRGLAGAVYVDLTAGRRARPLRSGSLIPASGAVQLTDVISGFDAAARQAIARTMNGYGTGLAGRGETLGHTIAGAPSMLSGSTVTLRALRPRPGALSGAIGSARTVAAALAPLGDGTLGDLLQAGARVVATTGTHAGAIAQSVAATPAAERSATGVLPGAEVMLRRLGATATRLLPGVSALGRALPSLRALETQGAAVTRLGHIAVTAAPTVRALEPVLAGLRGPAAGLTPLSSPIWTLAGGLIPYRSELVQAPLGFTRWGNFTYGFGTGAGHRAVRFSMVLTCALTRDPYPAAGAAARERRPCP
jgi:ABC-type transporter Mla subunit MlaD